MSKHARFTALGMWWCLKLAALLLFQCFDFFSHFEKSLARVSQTPGLRLESSNGNYSCYSIAHLRRRQHWFLAVSAFKPSSYGWICRQPSFPLGVCSVRASPPILKKGRLGLLRYVRKKGEELVALRTTVWNENCTVGRNTSQSSSSGLLRRVHAHALDEFTGETFGGIICLGTIGGHTELLHLHYIVQFVCQFSPLIWHNLPRAGKAANQRVNHSLYCLGILLWYRYQFYELAKGIRHDESVFVSLFAFLSHCK